MCRKYFSDKEYNEIPCALVIARIVSEEIEIMCGNECYYNSFPDSAVLFGICAEDRPFVVEALGNIGKAEQISVSYKYVSADKKIRNAEILAKDEGGGAFLAIIRDTTEESELMSELKNENEHYSMLISGAGNIVFENDVASGAFTLYIPTEDYGMKRFVIENSELPVHPAEQKFISEHMYSEDEETLSARMKLPGSDKWTWYRMRRYFKHDKNGALIKIHGLITDISDEKNREEEINKRLDIDPILKVYNRSAAIRIIDKHIRDNIEARNYALLVIDIDDFKSVNDTHGHLYGDAVIEQTANTIREIVSDNGIVGRYGGDEFFAFLKNCDDAEIAAICDNIIEGVNTLHGAGKNMGVSMGVALGTGFEETPSYKTMFERADKALYVVKKNGKGHWRVYDGAQMSQENGRALDYAGGDDYDEYGIPESMDMMKVFLELSSLAKTSDAAVYNILRYVMDKFSFDWMQIMQVNIHEDKVTIKYEWCRDKSFRNNSGKSGYYIHSDIMLFHDWFKKSPIFLVCPDNIKGFSPKFQREFDKNMRYSVMYNANITMDDSFYMFVCTRFDKSREWLPDECEELNEACKMMTMYISQSNRETENERKLKRMVEYDRKTELYSIMEFYIQLGRLRKLAAENGERVTLIHVDIGHFLKFNNSFGFEAGDNVLLAYAREISHNFDSEKCIGAHLDGTDIYHFAFRTPNGEKDFIEKFQDINSRFCDTVNEKYPGADIILRTGVCDLKADEEGGIAFNHALLAKRNEKNKHSKSYYKIYGK